MAGSHNNTSGHETILVVTDTPEDLDHLQSLLGGADYRLVQTWGVETAMAKLEAETPDLVLLWADSRRGSSVAGISKSTLRTERQRCLQSGWVVWPRAVGVLTGTTLPRYT